jgi:hypothetical protein
MYRYVLWLIFFTLVGLVIMVATGSQKSYGGAVRSHLSS